MSDSFVNYKIENRENYITHSKGNNKLIMKTRERICKSSNGYIVYH